MTDQETQWERLVASDRRRHTPVRFESRRTRLPVPPFRFSFDLLEPDLHGFGFVPQLATAESRLGNPVVYLYDREPKTGDLLPARNTTTVGQYGPPVIIRRRDFVNGPFRPYANPDEFFAAREHHLVLSVDPTSVRRLDGSPCDFGQTQSSEPVLDGVATASFVLGRWATWCLEGS